MFQNCIYILKVYSISFMGDIFANSGEKYLIVLFSFYFQKTSFFFLILISAELNKICVSSYDKFIFLCLIYENSVAEFKEFKPHLDPVQT